MIDKFIEDIKKKAKKHGVEVIIRNNPLVKLEGEEVYCAGFFCSETKQLVVGKQPKEADTIGLLAHESCHMDQWIEDNFLWEKLAIGYDLFFSWVEGHKIIKREHLEEAIQDIIRLEKDCEQRAIKKMLKYNIKIDYDKYRRRANAYLYAYLFFLEKKAWIPKIYDKQEVWAEAPARFPKEYKKIPIKLYRKFQKSFNAI